MTNAELKKAADKQRAENEKINKEEFSKKNCITQDYFESLEYTEEQKKLIKGEIK